MTHDTRHGGPYDRGAADSYYGRSRQPHYFQGASYTTPEITTLTDAEAEAYHAGYDANEASGEKKDWGPPE